MSVKRKLNMALTPALPFYITRSSLAIKDVLGHRTFAVTPHRQSDSRAMSLMFACSRPGQVNGLMT